MADSDTGTSGSGSPKLRFDDIVARVNADPAQPGATLLSGFIGKGGAEGRVRIYPDIGFSSWQEVAEADIVHSVPFPAESSPLGGSHVWVKAGANIEPGPAQARPVPYTVYPQITCGFVCHTQQDCPPAGATPVTVPPWVCTETIVPTRYMTCPPHICTETMPPTRHIPCPPVTVPPHICTETMAPTRYCPQHPQGAAAARAAGPQAPTLFCQPTQSGSTCPNGDCTFFGNCATQLGTTCPNGDCTFFGNCQTQLGSTCPNGDCTFFGNCPTHAGQTCSAQICDPAGGLQAGRAQAPAIGGGPSQVATCGEGNCTQSDGCTWFFNCQSLAGSCALGCTQQNIGCPTVGAWTCARDCTHWSCPTLNTDTCPSGPRHCPTVQGFPCHFAVNPQPVGNLQAVLPFSLQQSCGIACTYVPACPVPTPNCTLPSVTCPITPARTGIFNPLGR
jgi:hypothetical protein